MTKTPVRCLTLFTLFMILLPVSCSKEVLTEAGASKLAQAYVDAQGGGFVTISIAQLTNFLGKQLVQAPQELPVGMQRALNGGVLQKQTVTVAYPNFSGTFQAEYGRGDTCICDGKPEISGTLTLQTGGGRPPQVHGTWNTCGNDKRYIGTVGNCGTRTLAGVVEQFGPSHLTVTVPTLDGPIPRSDRLDVSLVRGNPDQLVGTYTNAQPMPFKAAGTSGPEIHETMYVYTWSAKLPGDAILNGAVLKAGHLVVDGCQQLLLNSETSASATCQTHVDRTKTAEVILNSSIAQPMNVVFNKKPDQSWIAVQIGYNAPQYTVYQ